MCHSCEHNHKNHHEHHRNVVCGNNDFGFVACEHKCCHVESDCDMHVSLPLCSCLECHENNSSYFIPLTLIISFFVAYLELYATLLI